MTADATSPFIVISAKAGTQYEIKGARGSAQSCLMDWVPAFAGMTIGRAGAPTYR